MINYLANLLQSTRAHDYIIESTWVWAFAEILHFIGLCILMGPILAVDLALMGLLPGIKLLEIKSLLRFAILGFMMSATAGAVFVIGDPFRYLVNTAFQIKIILLLLLGLSALYFWIGIRSNSGSQLGERGNHKFRLIGAASLFTWLLVIICGRLIPYVE